MSKSVTLLSRLVVGMVIGLAVTFISVVGTLIFTFFSKSHAGIPGVISVWASEENNAVAVNFNPNFAGMIVMAVLVGLIYAMVQTIHDRRGSQVDSKL